MAYKPKSAVEDKEYDLYNVVYTALKEDGTNNEPDLKDYHTYRNKLTWTPFRRKDHEDGTFEFVAAPYISEASYESWVAEWMKLDEFVDKNIYSFIQDKTFTLIIYDDRDYDSVLTKDIIIKQYQSGYHRDTTDWKQDGVIIYNVANDTADFETFDGTNYFDLACLKESKVDEVFLCGYNISSNQVRQFAQSGERVFVFESNPYKINAIRSILRAQYDVKLCVSKTSTKAYQAYSLFRDPIGNIQPKDNKGLEVLKKYSDAITNSFSTYEQWQELEKVKKSFEEQIQDSNWRSSLVEILFGNDDPSFSLPNVDLDSAETSPFMTDLENKKLIWVGDAVAINTENVPTFAEVNKLIHDDRKYSQIITFYKHDADFWTVNIYKTERELLNPISTTNAETKNAFGVQNIWYTPTGISVVKVEDFTSGTISSVKWYNVSGKRSIPVNNYIYDNKTYQYVFDIDLKQYVRFDDAKYRDEITKTSTVEIHYGEDILDPIDEKTIIKHKGDKIEKPFMINNKIQTYSLSEDKSNIIFKLVYPDTIDIDFNKISLIDMLRNKYYCQGNKYVVTCSLTDKQMYECLKTKSIMG